MEMLVEAMEIDQTAQRKSIIKAGCWTMAHTHTWGQKDYELVKGHGGQC